MRRLSPRHYLNAFTSSLVKAALALLVLWLTPAPAHADIVHADGFGVNLPVHCVAPNGQVDLLPSTLRVTANDACLTALATGRLRRAADGQRVALGGLAAERQP